MKKWQKVETQVPDTDFVMQVLAAGKKLCLIRDENRLYAVQNTCPHAGGILSGGWCKHGQIVCPIHRYSYNLENGRGAAGQGDAIRTYAVEQRADGIYVELAESWFKSLFS